MSRIAAPVRRLFAHAGRHPLLAALTCGAVAGLALPPAYLLPGLLVGVAGLALLLLHTVRPGLAFAAGWCFGFGYHLVGLYWVGYAFLVDAEQFAVLMPFAVALLPAGLGLFSGLAGLLAVLAARPGALRVPALAAAWSLAEYLRGTVLTGFPWNQIGCVWSFSDAMVQSAAWLGASGLSFVTMLAAATPAMVACRRAPGIAACLAAAALLAGLWGAGALRLQGADPVAMRDLRLRIVQPNVDQREKWRPENREAVFAGLVGPTRLGDADGPALVIWPETATPFLFEELAAARRLAVRALPEQAFLISGTPRRVSGEDGTSYRNGLIALDAAGNVVAVYDKHHLVPFGEYLPARPWLGPLGLDKLVAGRGDFSFGEGPALMALPGVPPFQPLICYEVIFPREIGRSGRPAWLLNITNDAWFGDSPGPYQHLAMARLRAVEFGVPLIRAANTGISAVVDPYGRLLQHLPLDAMGVIDSHLPRELDIIPPYARYGELFLLFMVVCLLGGLTLWKIAGKRAS